MASQWEKPHHGFRGNRRPRERVRGHVVADGGRSHHVPHDRRRPEREGRVLSTRTKRPRIAITTDWLTSFGGAERVLQQLRVLYSAAPIYTSVFAPQNLPSEMRNWDVRPSLLQRFPLVRLYSRALLPLMPMAFEAFDFREYDVVLTMSSAFSKNVTTASGTRSVCYCLTPPRYLWDLPGEYLGGAARFLAAPVLAH